MADWFSACPRCGDGRYVEYDDELDQCGQTYLPARTRQCAECGYRQTERVLGEVYRVRRVRLPSG